MSIDQMRAYIMQAYPGASWAYKVSKMHNAQVVAVYHSILAHEEDRKREGKKKIVESDGQYRQMTLWEVYGDV